MIKKFFAWVKSLFIPVTIKETDVDEYIAKQSQERETVSQVRFVKAEDRKIDEPLAKDEVVVGVDADKETVRVVKVETKSFIRPKATATPPKPLDEQLRGVELPSYAQGKKLPPKAKRQFIDQARRAAPRKVSDNPASYGNSQINAAPGIDPVNAAMYGYAAATILSDDTPSSAPAPVEECRSSAATSTYSSSYSSSSSDDSYSSSSYGSSSSSYDSSSYDSGSSSSSCD